MLRTTFTRRLAVHPSLPLATTPITRSFTSKSKDRLDRLTEKVIQTSTFNASHRGAPRPPRGDDAKAGWKTTPPSRGVRNTGRPALPPGAQRQLKARRDKEEKRAMQQAEEWRTSMLKLKQQIQDDGINDGGDTMPGDLVEVRGDGLGQLAVVLSSDALDFIKEASAGRNILVLQASGEIQVWRSPDVMFRLPNFIDPSEAILASPTDVDHIFSLISSDAASESPSPSNSGAATTSKAAAMSLREPFEAPQFKARASICARLRTFSRVAEQEKQQIMPAFRDRFLTRVLGSQSKSQEEEEIVPSRIVSTMEAAKLLSGSSEITPELLIATHQLLMSHPELFIADSVSHRTSHLFAVRSAQEVKVLRQVQEWESKGHAALVSFCEKARTLRGMDLVRIDQGGEPKVEELGSNGMDKMEWNDQDRMILQFLKLSIGTKRHLQSDPFGASVMSILTRCGARIKLDPVSNDTRDTAPPFPGLELQHRLVQTFLAEIGALTPWTSPASLDPELVAATEHASPAPPPRLLKEASSLAGISAERHDFGDLPVYVVDDSTAHELDDGISIQRISDKEGPTDQFWLHIHVADPTRILHPLDELSRRARLQDSTLYFPDHRRPLLPDELLVQHRLGLGEKVDGKGTSKDSEPRHALTFSAKLSLDGAKVTDLSVRPSLLRNVQILNYDDVDAGLSGQVGLSESAQQDFSDFVKVAMALQRRRIKGGALIVSDAYFASVSVGPLPLPQVPPSPLSPHLFTGFPTISIRPAPEVEQSLNPSFARGVVAELMILAGRVAGAFGKDRDVPLLYRTHDRPRQEVVEQLEGLRDAKTGLVPFEEVTKLGLSLSSAGISDMPQHHFTLGIGLPQEEGLGDLVEKTGYVRCTSPLRRYSDLVCHWQMKACLLSPSESKTTTPRLPWTREQLRAELPHVTRSSVWVRSLQRSANDFWKVLHLERLLSRSASSSSTSHNEDKVQEGGGLGIEKAMIVLPDVRTNSVTLESRVRVRLLGLGLPAECQWPRGRGKPTLGEILETRIKRATTKGLKPAVLVELV